MDKREEVIQAINTINDDSTLEKLHIFLNGMIAQQNIEKKTA